MTSPELPQVLLFGRNGQVGWELRRTLAPLTRVAAIDFPEVDLADADSIRDWIRKISPRVVINAAAYTAVDKAEDEPDLAHRINGLAPGIMAEEAARLGAWLVHFSTDYIFDGRKTEPYLEEDAPNPLSVYGRSKLAGDRAVQAVNGRFLIFRLCWVYGTRGHNFLRTIQRLARERKHLRVVSDQVGNPSWSRLIAESVALALQRALTDPAPEELCGAYHLSSSGQTSWHKFAEAIVAQLPAEQREGVAVEAIGTKDYPTRAARPAFSVLSCAKLHRTFGLRLPEWQESLARALEP